MIWIATLLVIPFPLFSISMAVYFLNVLVLRTLTPLTAGDFLLIAISGFFLTIIPFVIGVFLADVIATNQKSAKAAKSNDAISH